MDGHWDIRIVSTEDSRLLLREKDPACSCSFSYESTPDAEAVNVFFGPPTEPIPVELKARSIFVLTEPPEIMRYDTSYLSSFGLVIGPQFRYLRRLPNYKVAFGVLLWRIGAFPETQEENYTLTRQELQSLEFPTGFGISAVVSGKTKTPMQRDRLALVSYLEKRLDNFILYGRDYRLLPDKLDAHLEGIFHLAIENSNHPYYFTEKLTDPLLVGNHVFYGGNKKSRSLFNSESITPISWWSPRKALRQIQSVVENYDPDIYRPAKIQNRNYVFRQFNLQSEICRILREESFDGRTEFR